MEGTALGSVPSRNCLEMIYDPRWRQSFLNPLRQRGRDALSPGKQDLCYLGMCISVDNIFIVSTNKLWNCFCLALEWEVAYLSKIKMFHFKLEKLNFLPRIILCGILGSKT